MKQVHSSEFPTYIFIFAIKGEKITMYEENEKNGDYTTLLGKKPKNADKLLFIIYLFIVELVNGDL